MLQDWRPKANVPDRTKWWLGIDGEFSLGGMKTIIKDKIAAAEEVGLETTWSKLIPKKVAILVWRVKLGRVPCRAILDKMGLDLHSTLCPRCSKEVESIDHAFFHCEEVSRIWRGVARWWNRDLGTIDSWEALLASNTGMGENGNQQNLWNETIWAFIYLLWGQRNRLVFDFDKRKLEDLFFEFQRKTFEWIANRVRRKKIDWNLWLSNPSESMQFTVRE